MQNWKKIKELRMEARVSQSKLARYADLDRATVSRSETSSAVSELTVAKIADALGKILDKDISYLDLMDDKDI